MGFHSTLLWPSDDCLHCAQREAGAGSYFCIFSKDTPPPWASGKEAGDRNRFLCPRRETHLVCIPVSESIGCQTRVGAAHLFLRVHKEISVEVCAQIKQPSRWSPPDECSLLCKAWSTPFWVIRLLRLAGDLKRKKTRVFTTLLFFPFSSRSMRLDQSFRTKAIMRSSWCYNSLILTWTKRCKPSSMVRMHDLLKQNTLGLVNPDTLYFVFSPP